MKYSCFLIVVNLGIYTRSTSCIVLKSFYELEFLIQLGQYSRAPQFTYVTVEIGLSYEINFA